MRIIILLIIITGISLTADADEKYEDVTASVSVNSAFKLSADTTPIDFGIVDPGKIIELYPDRHFNEVRCASNNGRTWYLKTDCDNLTGPKAVISKSHLKFRIFWTNGKGYRSTDWMSFGDAPVLAYTSGDSDNMGAAVRIQFTYKLEPPPGVPAGNYNAIVTYTMTETP